MSEFQAEELHRVASCLVNGVNDRFTDIGKCAAYIMATARREYPFPKTGYVETAGFCVTAYVTSEGNHQYKVTLSSYGVDLWMKQQESKLEAAVNETMG